MSLLGHDVVIFEREERAGGMLRYGIPEFRLPRDTLDIELHNALRLGVQIRTGVEIGNKDGQMPMGKLQEEFDAVLLATGCMAASPLPLLGEWEQRDLRGMEGVEYGLDFLMEMHRGVEKTVGKRVAVVGAGFTALDCARVAARLGAQDVTIHIRTAEEYIPVTQEEIFEAKREGVRIKGLRTPVGLTAEGNRLTGIEFVQNRLGGWRSNGRRQAIAIEGSEFIEPCDTIIIAIGQQTANDYLGTKLELDRWGNVRIGVDGMTSHKGMFAAGDYVSGASTVVQAVGHGRQVAKRIDAWLMGRERAKQVVRIVPVEKPLRERAFDFITRQHMPTAHLDERMKDGRHEVELGLDEKLAFEEAKRCYLCNLRYQIDVDRCIFCRACIEVAPRNCIKLVRGVEIDEQGAYGKLLETKEWNQVGAIWIDNNECIRCGQCYTACPVQCISISRCELTEVEI